MLSLDKITSAMVGASYTLLTVCVAAVFVSAFTPTVI